MKSILFSGVVAAALLFSGCSSKDPKVEDDSGASAASSYSTTSSTPSSSSESVSGGLSEAELKAQLITRLEGELQTINFDFDKFNINAQNRSKVPANAGILKGEARGLTTKLEGNCDEWGSDEYNMALGLKRANEVKKALVAEGVDGSSITMVSYGENSPLCIEKTRECWAKNRRVDFKLLP